MRTLLFLPLLFVLSCDTDDEDGDIDYTVVSRQNSGNTNGSGGTTIIVTRRATTGAARLEGSGFDPRHGLSSSDGSVYLPFHSSMALLFHDDHVELRSPFLPWPRVRLFGVETNQHDDGTVVLLGIEDLSLVHPLASGSGDLWLHPDGDLELAGLPRWRLPEAITAELRVLETAAGRYQLLGASREALVEIAGRHVQFRPAADPIHIAATWPGGHCFQLRHSPYILLEN